jgi:hypothetical protein
MLLQQQNSKLTENVCAHKHHVFISKFLELSWNLRGEEIEQFWNLKNPWNQLSIIQYMVKEFDFWRMIW